MMPPVPRSLRARSGAGCGGCRWERIQCFSRSGVRQRAGLWRTTANLRAVLVDGALHANKGAKLDALELMAIPAADAFLFRLERDGRRGASQRLDCGEEGCQALMGALDGTWASSGLAKVTKPVRHPACSSSGSLTLPDCGAPGHCWRWVWKISTRVSMQWKRETRRGQAD